MIVHGVGLAIGRTSVVERGVLPAPGPMWDAIAAVDETATHRSSHHVRLVISRIFD
jgi:hypothetical protein